MGYIMLRHVFEWCEINSYKSFALKYNKYFKLNNQNLKSCKMKALTEQNFDQIENFVEYEDFLNNSYFYTLMKNTQYLVDFVENSST